MQIHILIFKLFFFTRRMGVMGNEETSNIRLQVCVFEQVCLSFFLSFFLVWLIGFTAYQPFSGGARGVVVIAVGSEHGDTSSNPGREWLHFT